MRPKWALWAIWALEIQHFYATARKALQLELHATAKIYNHPWREWVANKKSANGEAANSKDPLYCTEWLFFCLKLYKNLQWINLRHEILFFFYNRETQFQELNIGNRMYDGM